MTVGVVVGVIVVVVVFLMGRRRRRSPILWWNTLRWLGIVTINGFLSQLTLSHYRMMEV